MKTPKAQPMPAGMTEAHSKFLDDVRESGQFNMGLAPMLLREAFDLNKKTAMAYAMHWMKNFGREVA